MEMTLISKADLESVIRDAARRGAEEALRNLPKNEPEHYNYTDAARRLGLSRQTVAKMVKAGRLQLNGCGMIPAESIDAALKRTDALKETKTTRGGHGR